MREEKSCGTIILDKDKVLIIKQESGFYGFPKGHIEEGETEEETAIRETKEETNLDVKIISKNRYAIEYFNESKKCNKVVVYFLANLNGDSSIKPQDGEVKEAFWVDIDKVSDNLTFDNMKKLWLKMYNDIKMKNI